MYNHAVVLKNTALLVAATFGGAVAQLLGGWDALLKALIVCMAVDYVTGVVAAALGRSKKSKTGRITSKAAVTGIIKKAVILLIVLVAAVLESATGTEFIRDTVILFFIGTEGISIVENAGLLGVPMPAALKKWFEVLRDKGDDDKHGPGAGGSDDDPRD